MSKSKNKSIKPQENEIKEIEELEADAEETIEASVEENTEEITEEAEETVSEDIEAAEEDETGESAEDEAEEEEEPVKVSKKKAEVKKASSSSKEDEEFRQLPFVEKCRKDPVIPVCIFLAILALIVAGIYFMLPNLLTPSMGMTLSEFQSRYNDGQVSASLINSGVDITFRTPEYVDITAQPSILGDKAVVTAKTAYADFFSGPFKYYSIGGVEGATRKSDKALSYIRVYVNYSDEDFNSVWMYASNTISALYPNLTRYQAMDLGMKIMGEYDGDERFYVKGDYAFRLVAVKKTADGGGELVYIVIDCVPRSAIKDSQIREEVADPVIGEGEETTAASTSTT
jgi:hypothetical protein